ncbi:RNase P modulator RnpM [Xylocopilactobacillus apis]|uniref:DNA-binding protein n=1 Tax=Xylocopilactobacillus apis TaxID=2932183 RepID=A0AAU9DRG8_9LACO|nr:YlxR family protein [Xylocopilactobacillus apis]BDR56253.1 DNA-binding protein [Xylocopilactobacillus apis]
MRKESLRMDLITRRMFPKKELIRIVRNKDYEIKIDPTGKAAGRGAYISLDLNNIEVAKKKKVFDQAFGIKVNDQFYKELYEYIEHRIARNELFRSKK